MDLGLSSHVCHMCASVFVIPSADVNMVACSRALSKRLRLRADRSDVSSQSSDSLSPAGPVPPAVTTAVLSGLLSVG